MINIYCPNCGTERYNTANYCFQCKFDFNTILLNYDNNVHVSTREGHNLSKVNNRYFLFGLIIGIVSMFLAEIGIIPLTGIVINVLGFMNYNSKIEKNYWMGVVGFCLSAVYMIVNIYIHSTS